MNEKIELDEKTLDIIRRNNKLTLSVRTAMRTLERTLFTKNDLTIFFFLMTMPLFSYVATFLGQLHF